ncbi:MAG: lycopene beta-cyclase [Crocinitomicaceae bacterium]
MKQPAISKAPSAYDFLFIGLGAANSLLILSLYKNGLLDGKTIAIIEPSNKLTNDKTFCFWSTKEELFTLNLEKLVSFSWEHIEITGVSKQNIQPLKYYHVKGIDLSNKTKEVLSLNKVTYYSSPMNDIPWVTPKYCDISIGEASIRCAKVFDSRPPSFLKLQKNKSHIHQSFYGWKIKTSKEVFDSSSMVMMDFKIPQTDFTQFIYILPFEKDTALIELTRFGKDKLSEEEAMTILLDYIHQLGITFDIIEHEIGVIPMCSGKIEVTDFGSNWINMGARANLLKCSTGYAFHSMAEDAIIQMEAVKYDQVTARESRKSRFLFYDRLLLKILSETPENGSEIFEKLFKEQPTIRVLKFMREKTNFLEELFIFSKLPKKMFIGAAIKDIIYEISRLPIVIFPFIFTAITILLSLYNIEFISWGILVFGFLTVGLAHGALDHLTSQKVVNSKQLFYFVISYLSKGILFALVWWVSSDIALSLFILFSAWHFGQADFKEWSLKQGWQSFLWGGVVLMIILFFHIEEFTSILQQIPNLSSSKLLNIIPDRLGLFLQILTVSCGLFLALLNKSRYMLLSLIYLLMASELSLLMAFGIYFVGQHSMSGWKHLSIGLNKGSSTMWLNSLPFTLGGTFIIFCFLFFTADNYIGIFFIILSCLSLPHVFSMHFFYRLFLKKNKTIN